MDVSHKVLYISYDGMTDPLGQSQVLPYLCGLSEKDYRFYLISCEKPKKYKNNRSNIENLCIQNNIIWRPLSYHKFPPVFSSIYNVFLMLKSAKAICESEQIKIVHCRSYIASIIGLYLKRRYNVKFIFDMRGFWPDERVDGRIWNINNPIYKLIYLWFKKKENSFFTESNYTISLTEIGKKEIESKTINSYNKPPIQVIPCCVDTTFFKASLDQNILLNWRNKLSISINDFTICYLGNFSTVYLFDEVLDIVYRLKKVNQAVQFRIFTHESKDIVTYFLEKNNLAKASWIKTFSLERNEVPQALSVCDYSIYFCEPSPSRKGTSPTRLAELLSCGIKVISNAHVGDTESIIENNQLGIILKKFDQASKLELINKFSFDKIYNKDKLRQYAIEHFDIKIGVIKYLEVYNSLVNNESVAL